RLTACALRRRPTTLLFEKGREGGGTEGRRGVMGGTGKGGRQQHDMKARRTKRAQPSPHHSPRAATRTPLCTLLATENRGPPPSPSPSSTLPSPSSPCRLKPPFSPLLRARPRQTKTNYAAFSEPQRAPTSYTASLSRSLLRHLRPRSSSTSFHGIHLLRRPTILTPLSSSLPRPPPTNSSTHSGRASCPRTTSRLLQPPANFRVFFSSPRLASPRLASPRLLLSNVSCRRTCIPVTGDNSG
ncbi:hypothetical protein ALC53_11039, partial [Atta colombica]